MMRLAGLSLRDFRGYAAATVDLGDGLTVISGANGAGKTNLLEAVYFGCTGRSCRTNNERELLRFSAQVARVVVTAEGEDGTHELAVGFEPGRPKRMSVDGAPVERMLDVPDRPLVSVFLPDRLELVKGAPTLRRAHLDQVIAALWPSRVGTRRSYAQALAQRNALIARLRSGSGSRDSLATWDAQLARHGVALMSDRREAAGELREGFRTLATELGLGADASLEYRPRSRAQSELELAAELEERRDADLDRGFTGHGPHRDDLVLRREGRDLRAYGSQGQQRLALLSLLLTEREAIAGQRTGPPVMLLDDVMSELDSDRRRSLVDLLRSTPGQSVITTTDLEHVPGAGDPDVTRVAVSEGRILQEVFGGLPSAVGEGPHA
jgi:DNA replication and repair protein RecF